MMEQQKGNILLYQTVDGNQKIEVNLINDTVWLSLDQIADLFQRNKSTISRHIKNIFEECELELFSTVAKFATVQIEGTRQVEREIEYYNLDVIISIGYRVKSLRGTHFRMWATKTLREYLIKGFVMNDDLLKQNNGNYFDELISRIRDIRSSEKIFYRKILEIYATSIDYDPRNDATQRFFATVQNKMHFSVHGHTAAEVIYNRVDSEKDFMGLTSWSGHFPSKSDTEYAKNYLSEDEVDTLNLIVSLYLDFAELQAKNKTPMFMVEWLKKLDDFLTLSGKELLSHAGRVSAQTAKLKANQEYIKFIERSKNELTQVEIHFLESIQQAQKKLK